MSLLLAYGINMFSHDVALIIAGFFQEELYTTDGMKAGIRNKKLKSPYFIITCIRYINHFNEFGLLQQRSIQILT